MGIVSWVVLGGIAGWLASIVMGKNAYMGIFANIIVGIIGAFIGGFIMSYWGGWSITGFNGKSLFVAFLGSVVLLAIINIIKRGRIK